MGLGQTMLSVLALMMLGTLFLSVNTNTTDSGVIIEQSEYEIVAASLGISMLERATGLAFDENTVVNSVLSPNGLTPAAGLGKEAGEIESTFDDFDDYNGLNKYIPGDSLFIKSADYSVAASVDYVTIVGDSVVAAGGGTRTYHKRLTVKITSPFMTRTGVGGGARRDTLVYQTVYSYWYFR